MTRRPALFPVLLVNFIGTLGFSIVLPFLVFLVARFGGNAVVYGLVGATYPAFQLLGAPILGRWSDLHGRRKILLLSQAGTLASWIVFAAALYLPVQTVLRVEGSWLGDFRITVPLLVVFVARAMDGLTGGNISVANAYLADVSSEQDRARNFGRMGVSSNLGFVLGPALASLLGALGGGEALPVFAALAVSAVATLVIALALPESRPCPPGTRRQRDGLRQSLGQEPVDCTRVAESRSVGFAGVWSRPALRLGLGLYFLIFLGFSLFYVAFPVRAATDLGWSVGRTGAFFVTLSLLMVVVQGPVLSRLAARVSDTALIVSGGLLLTASFSLLVSDATPQVFAAAALFAMGNGIMWPTVQAVLSRATPGELQGATQGYAGAAGSLASILGLLAGGLSFESFGTVTFVAAATILAASTATAIPWVRLAARQARWQASGRVPQ